MDKSKTDSQLVIEKDIRSQYFHLLFSPVNTFMIYVFILYLASKYSEIVNSYIATKGVKFGSYSAILGFILLFISRTELKRKIAKLILGFICHLLYFTGLLFAAVYATGMLIR